MRGRHNSPVQHTGPTTMEAINRNFLHGTGRNRWFDKVYSTSHHIT